MSAPTTMRVFIPLTIRKRNGRPKIVPPADLTLRDGRAQDQHVLRAIARAWSWRRQLETGATCTIQDIAAAEKVSDRFVSRMMRLAYPQIVLFVRRRCGLCSHLGTKRKQPAARDGYVRNAEQALRRRAWTDRSNHRVRLRRVAGPCDLRAQVECSRQLPPR